MLSRAEHGRTRSGSHPFHGSNFPGIYIPQSVWVPAAGPRDWDRMPTIRFTQNGRQEGVNLGDAYRRNFNGMLDSQVIPCTSTTSQRVAIRINWPGYEPWHKHVNVANNSEHVNKARLAYEVARRWVTTVEQKKIGASRWCLLSSSASSNCGMLAVSWQPFLVRETL
ncbi:hypothetical protein PHLGIDRAFT_462833 [Phlebiopsis gigantea 11061_1 CR5-6]|uniref:Uncharacterized protein n=1 Tax=Phlebiopsis gigantea (strain 11061_1 CR5-6) TaxID=745531 RepID=A0A0C3NMY3_PHLG1|nr:hypothetical protein PHLGIDRAFT_462833 [Phlebiopsis gigantea 11061_1 CR5-6]